MTFERIVRPFETVRVMPYPQGATTIETSPTPAPIALAIGQEGTVKTLTGSGSSTITTFQETKTKEISRETVEKRVENPEDSAQYVMVANTKKLETESGKGANYEKRTFEFKDED